VRRVLFEVELDETVDVIAAQASKGLHGDFVTLVLGDMTFRLMCKDSRKLMAVLWTCIQKDLRP
jgi:hypothetical protein